eukprot:4478229-Amphidinium_carterae.3
MKKEFVGQDQKGQLMSGNIVVQLIGTSLGDHQETWLHISSLYLSPYKASMLLMQKEDKPTLLTCGEEPSDDRVYLKALMGQTFSPHICHWNTCDSPILEATSTFLTDLEAIQLLDTSLVWQATWWILELQARPLAFLRADLVSVVPWQTGQLTHLWPPPRKKTSKASQGSWASVLASSASTARQTKRQSKQQRSTTPENHQGTEHPPAEVLGQVLADLDERDDIEASEESELEPLDVNTIKDVGEPDENVELDLLLEAALEQDLDLQAIIEQSMDTSQGAGLDEAASSGLGQTLHVASTSGASSSTDLVQSTLPAAAAAMMAPPAASSDGAWVPHTAVPSAESKSEVKGFKATSAVRGPVVSSDATVRFAGGKLAYYWTKDCIEATCMNKSHGPSCKLTRTCRGRHMKNKTMVAGRPLGVMAVWLQQHTVAEKALHKVLDNETYSWANRKAARQLLQSSADSAGLFMHEREKIEGEDSEPETLQGLL